MKKYGIPAVMLIAGHEVVSILALIVAMTMFIGDVINQNERRYF